MGSTKTNTEPESSNSIESRKDTRFWGRSLKTTIIGFLAFFGLISSYVFFSGSDVHWGGLISMLVFYAAVYYIGSIAAERKGSNTIKDMMVAGRAIPLWIAVFTMTATWVGGGLYLRDGRVYLCLGACLGSGTVGICA